MKIREANRADIAAMSRVTVDTFLTAHHFQIPESVWEWRRDNWTYEVSARGWARLLGNIESGSRPLDCLFVAESESGEVVGVAMCQLDDESAAVTAEITALYVHTDHQRNGHGRRLLSSIAQRMSRNGIARLRIGTLATNEPARRFYEALGGKIEAEREIEDGGQKLTEVVYGWSDIGALGQTAAAEFGGEG